MNAAPAFPAAPSLAMATARHHRQRQLRIRHQLHHPASPDRGWNEYPLISNGRIGVTSAAGPQTTTIRGDVTVNLVNPATGVTAVGDYNTHTRNITLDIGPDVKVNASQTNTNRALYGISARTANAPIVVNSSASVDMNYSNAGTTGNWRAYNLYSNGGECQHRRDNRRFDQCQIE